MTNKLRKNFCVFVLSHGRPDNIKTLRLLERLNYDGPLHILIDNEDSTAEQYYNNFGDKVIMFDKMQQASKLDPADNFNDRRTIIYARNACFDVAKKLGYEYFLELDDDYTEFAYRFKKGSKLANKKAQDINLVFEAFLQFLDDTKADTVAFAQGGDFIGGLDGGVFKKGLIRKAMNSFFFRTDSDLRFVGRINEDVNTYCNLGSKGRLFLTYTKFYLNQETTQKSEGGMSDVYLASGTYLKSFYTIIFNPSSVKIKLMGNKNMRMHHSINWNNTVPKIINEKYKK